MAQAFNILIIGTVDTKADELQFMRQCIEQQGARAILMDVGVLGEPALKPEIDHYQVAAAAGMSLAEIIALDDENLAMTHMARGAVNLTLARYRNREIHGVLALGGTMGTDLALDVTAALPLGMPKFIVTTVAFSHLIPPERLAPDLMMILWAGGLFGLNTLCQNILAQAAGAVLGACRAVQALATAEAEQRPRVAIGSLGKSCLRYMVELTPALIERGYEPVVFHCTGMGGRAMEALIEQGEFVAVFDFALGEVSNHCHESVVTAGADRLEAPGRRGIPHLVAPGASDMVDVPSWRPLPPAYADRPYHAHNRLIGSYLTNAAERCQIAQTIADKLNRSQGPCTMILPHHGLHAWDRPGQALHDPQAHAAYLQTLRSQLQPPVECIELDAHINDPAFVACALAQFDRWVSQGRVPPP